MKHINYLLFGLLFAFGFAGCEKKDIGALHEVHWDRDMCVRCKMVVSERHHGVQVIDMQSGKYYMFDDVGCMVLWFDENRFAWEKEAKIWITDMKTGKWIDAKTAFYDTINITPMAYGIAAHETNQTIKAGEEIIDFEQMRERVREIEAKTNRKAY
jgi:nitrous oxide reductase accessory protein NosL